MKPCPEYENELAACAGLPATPSHAVAAHLEHCDRCQSAFRELQSVAAIHLRAAADLPRPKLNPVLGAWFLESHGNPNRKSAAHSWLHSVWLRWSVLGATAALALVLLGLFVARTAPQTAQRSPSNSELPAATIATRPVTDLHAAADTTWQTLRREVQRDNDLSLAPGHTGRGIVAHHYRLKDAYAEAN